MTTSPRPQTNLRFEWVDYVKGLGIVLVVIGHTLRGLINAGLLESSPASQFADDWIYAFHMPLFFFLSGLFAEHSFRKGPVPFVADKLRTIAYPYIIWASLQTGVQILLSGYVNQSLSWHDLLKIVYQPPMQFWFLYALFGCSLAFLGCRQLGLGKLGFFVMAVAAAVAQTWGVLGSWGVINQVGSNLPYFALGVVTFPRIRNVMSNVNWRSNVAITITSYGLMTFIVLAGNSSEFQSRVIAAPLGIAATLSFAGLLEQTHILKWVQYLGQASLPIYVAHTLASAGFRIVMQKFAHVNDPMFHLMGGVLAGLLIPILLNVIAPRVGFPYLFSWPRRTTVVKTDDDVHECLVSVGTV